MKADTEKFIIWRDLRCVHFVFISLCVLLLAYKVLYTKPLHILIALWGTILNKICESSIPTFYLFCDYIR
uniref:Putative secreted protein n=1 Tax=Xenopsylla cheopis TaxID=163159 RepID=A0A6M2DXW8_XENCH